MELCQNLSNMYNQMITHFNNNEYQLMFSVLIEYRNLIANTDSCTNTKLFEINEDIMYAIEVLFEKYYSNIIQNYDQFMKVFPYYNKYYTQIYQELMLMNGDNEAKFKSVVFIGCGSLPISAIFYNIITQLPVIAIDMDLESCQYASNFINKLELSKSIDIVNIDAQYYDYNDDQLVVIANMIINLENVIKILSKKHIKYIIYRNTSGLRSMYYQHLNDDIIKSSYENIKCTNPVDNGFISTSFLCRIK